MTKLREKPPDEVEEEPAPKLDIVHTTQTMMYHAKEETICEDSRAAAKKKKTGGICALACISAAISI
jgi:hypothetical protein